MKLNEGISSEEKILEDEDFFMTVDDMSDIVFNSRGPRSIYRGLEEVEEYVIWDEEEEEDEVDYYPVGTKLWKYFDY